MIPRKGQMGNPASCEHLSLYLSAGSILIFRGWRVQSHHTPPPLMSAT